MRREGWEGEKRKPMPRIPNVLCLLYSLHPLPSRSHPHLPPSTHLPTTAMFPSDAQPLLTDDTPADGGENARGREWKIRRARALCALATYSQFHGPRARPVATAVGGNIPRDLGEVTSAVSENFSMARWACLCKTHRGAFRLVCMPVDERDVG